MRLVSVYRNALLRTGLLSFLIFVSGPSQAITLNFSATLVEGTCDIALNPSNLALTPISLSQLEPVSLLSVAPFILSVQNCTAGTPSLTPGVTISGLGQTNYSGKWLFRSDDSTASGVGVMLVAPGVTPEYGSPAIGNGDSIDLDVAGATPGDQSLEFHAGIACINAGCTATSAGAFSATITFEFNYR